MAKKSIETRSVLQIKMDDIERLKELLNEVRPYLEMLLGVVNEDQYVSHQDELAVQKLLGRIRAATFEDSEVGK